LRTKDVDKSFRISPQIVINTNLHFAICSINRVFGTSTMAHGSPGFLQTQFEHLRFVITPQAPWQFTTSPIRNYLSENKYFPVLCMSSPITINYGYPDKESHNKTLCYPADYFVPATKILSMSTPTINNCTLCCLESHTNLRTGKSYKWCSRRK
jgi:hypothetical protein